MKIRLSLRDRHFTQDGSALLLALEAWIKSIISPEEPAACNLQEEDLLDLSLLYHVLGQTEPVEPPPMPEDDQEREEAFESLLKFLNIHHGIPLDMFSAQRLISPERGDVVDFIWLLFTTCVVSCRLHVIITRRP